MNGEKRLVPIWQLIVICAVVVVLAVVIVCAIVFASDIDPNQNDNNAALTGDNQTVYVTELGDSVSVGQKISPSVVFINNIVNYNQNNTLFNIFGYGYYNSSTGDNDTEEIVSSTGSGVIYSEDGYIITNYHVVEGADKISVTLYDGTEYLADVIGTDEVSDLAVLKIDAQGLTAAEFGDSDNLVIGEMAVAIGNPGGSDYQNSLTVGVVSGLNRYVASEGGSVISYIQTDAAINPGNSGGPLCNGSGQVIGINTVKISADAYEGMGFAIPSNTVLDICKQLIEDGSVARPGLGVGVYGEISKQMAYYYDLGIDYGIMIKPTAGGAAEKAGLEDYDIIIAVDGEKVESTSDLQEYLFTKNIGDTVTITVYRDGAQHDYQVVLEELQSSSTGSDQ